MEKEFEKVYILRFDTQQEAAGAIDKMQYDYRSVLYEYHMEGQFVPNKFVVTFPEGAMCLLPEEWQKKAEDCQYPTQGGCFIPTVYRFMEEQYIDEFLEKGTLQISTFKHCKRLEDPIRKDGKEGQSVIVGVHGAMKMETQMITGDNAYVLCSSLASEYRNEQGIVNKIALEITDMGRFVDECTKAITAKGYHVLNVQIGPCFYSEKKIHGELSKEDADKLMSKDFTVEDIFAIPQRISGPKMYFQKPIEKACEMEYRMVWMVYPDPKEETMLIQLENMSQYSRKSVIVDEKQRI